MDDVTHLNRRRPGDPDSRARLAEGIWTVMAALQQLQKVAKEYECLDIHDALEGRVEDLYALGDAIEGGEPLPQAAMRPGDLPRV